MLLPLRNLLITHLSVCNVGLRPTIAVIQSRPKYQINNLDTMIINKRSWLGMKNMKLTG